jgi:hypothetical protein
MTDGQSQPAAAEAKRRWYRVTPDRLVLLVLAVEGLLWLAERFGCFPKGYAVLLAAAGVAVAMLLMLLWFAASLVFRWRFQFSIGSLLVLAVVVAMACGWFASAIKEARDQKEAVAGISESGGLVITRYDPDNQHILCYDPDNKHAFYGYGPDELAGPAWLRHMLGDGFFNKVVGADLYSNAGAAYLKGLPHLQSLALAFGVTDDAMENVKGLSRVRSLEIQDTKITHGGLKHLSGLIGLQELNLQGDGMDDAGLEHLKALPRLERLNLCRTRITDAGFRQVKLLPHLRNLGLCASQLTKTSVKQLKAMPQLRELCFINTGNITKVSSIADEHLELLKELTQLETLNIENPQTTPRGLKRLAKALPKCKINIYVSAPN